MTDKHWKAKERLVAKKLKGWRNPMHGENDCDVESEVVCAEVTVHDMPQWIMQGLERAQRIGREKGKLPGRVVCPRGTSKAYAIMDLDDFAEWYV